MGDPAGVGPEIVLKALGKLKLASRVLLIGDLDHLHRVQKTILRKPLPPTPILDLNALKGKSISFGRANALAGYASGAYIERAIELAKAGYVDGIVTGPINKVSFKMGGWGKRFIGHTEMLAALTGTKNVRSMLMHENVRAIHVTSHVPLRDVARRLTSAKIYETILIANAGLKQLGIKNPRIAVAGLNPHAGDDGVLGKEEKTLILPAIKRAQRRGLRVDGPLSADAMWPMVRARRYDAGVAMYHDQGQIAVKLAGFSMGKNGRIDVRGIQMTLGLPFVRTSVDHGTAYDIAGKGIASEESMMDAIRIALRLVGSHG